MLRTPGFLLSTLLFTVLGTRGAAQEPIKLARTPDVSPDGKLVAFSYLGDIWVSDAAGGVARAVTVHRAHEMNPVFSPDGKWIAFSSNRHGSYNVFIIPVESGKPRRLTFDSCNEMVNGWTPDGKNVVFASTRDATWPVGFDLYTVPIEGGRPTRITTTEARDGRLFRPTAKHLAYVRGPGAWYRKGYLAGPPTMTSQLGLRHRRHASPPLDLLQRAGQFADVERRRPVDLLRQRRPWCPGQHRPAAGQGQHGRQAAADHLPQGRQCPQGPHRRQWRMDRLRMRQRPVSPLHARRSQAAQAGDRGPQ